jgi:hypothetical protein
MRTILAAVSILSLSVSSAHASAGLSCEASDKTVKLSIEAGISRGLGDDVFSFKGELDILSAGAPKDFRNVVFEKDHLTQRWLDDRNLKLRIYRERAGEPHGSVELVIEAWPRKESDGIEFRGGYVLTIFDIPKAGADGKTTILKGRVSCSVG